MAQVVQMVVRAEFLKSFACLLLYERENHAFGGLVILALLARFPFLCVLLALSFQDCSDIFRQGYITVAFFRLRSPYPYIFAYMVNIFLVSVKASARRTPVELKKCEFFIFVNLKGVLSDEKLLQVYEHCQREQVGLLLIENGKQRPLLSNEKAVIITEDLCEILENYQEI